jgi:hypothetical protein
MNIKNYLPIELNQIINQYAAEKNPLLVKELNNVWYAKQNKKIKRKCIVCNNTYKKSFIYHVVYQRSHPICLSCYNPNMEQLMVELEDECNYIDDFRRTKKQEEMDKRGDYVIFQVSDSESYYDIPEIRMYNHYSYYDSDYDSETETRHSY